MTNWPSSGGGGVFLRAANNTVAMTSKNQKLQTPPERPVPEETILKITKEIAIKFIEVGRLTPAAFDDVFKNIHLTVKQAAKGRPEQ